MGSSPPIESTPGDRPMRIAFVEGTAGMGGVEWSTLYLAQNLCREQWHPLVICPEEGDLTEACRRSEVEVRILSQFPLRSTSFRIGKRVRIPNPFNCAWDVFTTVRAAMRLAGLFREIKPNLVITKGIFPHIYGGLAARWAECPLLWHVQDFISERFWGLFRRLFGCCARWLPDYIVVDGSPIARQLPLAIRDRVEVIFNGINTDEFRPGRDGTAIRRELKLPPEAIVIGHVARMTPWKGQHFLLEAFARVATAYPQSRLLFVGSALFDGDFYERQLRERTTALGLQEKVIFAGYRHDLANVLAGMDIFAYPSVEKDTAPLSLLSAMAAGLPLVGFDIEGVREVVATDEAGLLIPVEDVPALAGALARVLADNGLRGMLGRAARRRAEEAFSIKCYIARFEQVIAPRCRMQPVTTDDPVPTGECMGSSATGGEQTKS